MQIDPNSVQWDDAPTPVRTAPASSFPGIIRGAPKTVAPREPKTTFRTLTPEEVAARGLPPGSYQESSEGKVDKVGGDTGAANASEGERNNKAYYDRAARALEVYDKKGLGPRSFAGQAVAALPGGETILRGLPDAVGDSPDRQITEQAKKDFVTMILRSDSGANAPEAEVMRAIGTYFPSAGETDPTVIENYAKARIEALNGLKEKAGRLSADIPDYTMPDGMTGDKVPADAPYIKDGGAYDKDGNYLGLAINMDDGPVDGGSPPPNDTLDPRIYNPEGAQGVFDLAKQGISLGFLDEAAGAGGYLGALLTGNDPSKAYTRERDASRENIRRARVAHPVVGTLAEFLGGGAGVKVAQGTMTVGNMVRQGAGVGALGGFGYGEGDNSLASAAGGAAFGGALGGAFGGVGRLVEARAARNALAPEQVNVIEAGQRQGIPIRQPDVLPELRGKYAAAESTEYGGKIISAGRADDANAIADRAAEVAGGTAFKRSDTTAMGQSVQSVASRGETAVKDSASKLYERVDRDAPDFKTEATATSKFIDDKIAELRSRSPTGYNAEIGALEGMKSDLAETGLSVGSLQAQRETVGGRIGDNVQDRTRADRTFSQVLDVAANELHTALRAENPQAAAMLKRADAKWGQYKRTQKEVTGLFLGKRDDATAESAARTLNAATRNNYSALRRFMAMSTPDEKADFAATFVQNWGSNQRGEFSPAVFAKSMEGVSDRTLSTILGSKGKEALRDLQAIANAKTDAMSRQAPSGKAVERALGSIKTAMLALFGFTTGGAGGAAAGVAAKPFLAALGEKRAARLLMNPDFTKLLRNAPNSNDPATINRYFSRIAGVLAANDNEALTNAIAGAFRKSPGVAAANDETDSRRVPPQ